MTNVRTELANTAAQVIRDLGQPMTLRKSTAGAYNVDTGILPATTVDHTVYVAFVREIRTEEFNLTRAESRRAYVATNLGVLLDTNDLIIGSGDVMKISRIHDMFIGLSGIGLLYVCNLQG